ncbi:hypothetical protein MTR_5g028820 [Medicago truncatula]|uniref:Uncharacterized protein n=1 Tax=Medicago truncatula TaxID=3880 RepID=G7KB01_MEDTR|nr:hypothetical protein MTR_5g028820 [Medicago truncatula]
MMVETKPINLNEAMKDSNWLVVMKLEFKYIEKNRTCEVTIWREQSAILRLQDGEKGDFFTLLPVHLKLRLNGEIAKYKVKLVARGFL